MNMKKSISRRNFIINSSKAGGALMLTFALPLKKSPLVAASETDFEPNAFIRISQDNEITLWVARSDMGQGVRTALPLILAEELEVDLDKVKIEQADTNRDCGKMGTGGSTSVKQSYLPLRQAGAAAREMLISAAANRWKIERSKCIAENGFIIHRGNSRKLSYGELVAEAAVLPVPEAAPLKEKKDFKLIGKSRGHLDTFARISGTAKYGIDLELPGMRYASVLRAPVFGAKIKSFDDAASRSIAGVLEVFKIERRGSGVLLSEGIAVVAENYWAAYKGRMLLQVDWDLGDNEKLGSADIRKQFIADAKKTGVDARSVGDAEKAFTGSEKKIESIFEVPFASHSPFEPMNCLADVRPDGVDIRGSLQSPQWVQSEIARELGIEKTQVTVHVSLLGGGFGRRLEPDVANEAALISKKIAAPVKVIWTREDDTQHGLYRPASYHVLQGALDKKGKPLVFSHKIVAPSISGWRWPDAVKNGLDNSMMEGLKNLPYNFPNLKLTGVISNTPVHCGWWRSVYNSQNAFANEVFMDELARLAGQDPFEFRLALLAGPNRELDHYHTHRLRKTLEMVAKTGNWGKPAPGRFQGIACHACFSSYAAEIMEISVEKSGAFRLHKVTCVVDCGTVINPNGVRAQVEGAIVYGLSAAVKDTITIRDGRVEQSNFHDYRILRIDEMPAIEVLIIDSEEAPTGMGEPALPPVAAALSNAIFAATGNRIRKLPVTAAAISGSSES